MLLAGILLKMGSYGLIRVSTLFFPESLIKFSGYFAILGAVNIILGAVFALAQTDIKKIIAYSSISHMGFILLGLASLNQVGINGAIFQSFSHGLISAGLFMGIGCIYERTHTRDMNSLGGIAQVMPVFFFVFLGLAMANLGLPLLSGFVGESMVFYSSFMNFSNLNFNITQICALISVSGLLITASYMLLLVKKIFFGELKTNMLENFKENFNLKKSEAFVLSGLLGISLLLGSFPVILNSKLNSQIQASNLFSTK